MVRIRQPPHIKYISKRYIPYDFIRIFNFNENHMDHANWNIYMELHKEHLGIRNKDCDTNTHTYGEQINQVAEDDKDNDDKSVDVPIPSKSTI